MNMRYSSLLALLVGQTLIKLYITVFATLPPASSLSIQEGRQAGRQAAPGFMAPPLLIHQAAAATFICGPARAATTTSPR